MAKEPKAAEPVAITAADALPAGPAFTVPVADAAAAPAVEDARDAMVDVILPIEVDGVRFAPGDVAAIRSDLVPALVSASAVALWQGPAAV